MHASWKTAFALLFVGCAQHAATPPKPAPAASAQQHSWSPPEVLVPPSAFQGIHGLAVDKQGRLLAGSVVGGSMWEVDRKTGEAKIFIDTPAGESDDIAIGPKGELAWTSYLQGVVRYRERDDAPIRELATGLAGINSLAFDQKTGKLYASQVFYGDALWEIDVAGKKPPRQIAKDMGGFNGFEVGPDGMLYGPLWFKGQVVKIDPKRGALTIINSEFETPAAVNLDKKGNAWVVDTHAGKLCKVVLKSGKKDTCVELATSLDNLAIAPEGTIYVSNMADNSIEAVDPESGSVQVLIRGKLATPAALKLDGDTLYVADIFSFRAIDVKTGTVRDVLRAHASKLMYPSAVGMSDQTITLTSAATNSVELVDRPSLGERTLLNGFKAPSDAIPLADGSLLVCELATGNLLRVSGPDYVERKVVAEGLEGPMQMILGQDGSVYLVEATGNLTRIDLRSGERRVLAAGLSLPDGLAQTPWGSLIVAESGARRLVEIDPVRGTRRTVAEDLPIGFATGRAGEAPAYLPTGVAVANDGVVYVSGDRDRSIMRIRPQR